MAEAPENLLGHPGGKLCLSREDPTSLAQIGFWPESAETVHKHVLDFAELDQVPAPGRFAGVADRLLVRSAFDTYLLLGFDHERLELASDQASVTNLSDARCGVAINGPACEPFLQRDVAVDLGLAACPVGSVVQTAMHHVPVMLLRRDETGFLLLAYRSYMEDLIDWMRDMAVPYAS